MVHRYFFSVIKGVVQAFELKNGGLSEAKVYNGESSAEYGRDFWEKWRSDSKYCSGDETDFLIASDEPGSIALLAEEKFALSSATAWNDEKLIDVLKETSPYDIETVYICTADGVSDDFFYIQKSDRKDKTDIPSVYVRRFNSEQTIEVIAEKSDTEKLSSEDFKRYIKEKKWG